MNGRGASGGSALAAATVCLLGLAACNSTGGVESTLGVSATPRTATDEVVDLRAYCPKTVMRAGTETHNEYPPKMKPDDPDRSAKLRFRATITDVVRECDYAGDVLNMKVGIAGRIVSGPAGETGEFHMQVRVAVKKGDAVLYSKLNDIVATIPPGRPNNNFAFVDDAISIPRPSQRNVVVYVGFDALGADKPGAVAPSASLQPIN